MRDKLSIRSFRQAIEAGRKGTLSLFDEWLKQFEMKSEDLDILTIAGLPEQSIEQLYVNRGEELDKVARAMGYCEQSKKLYFINVVGIPQVGKTAFLTLLRHYSCQVYSNKAVILESASRFKSDSGEGLYFDDWLSAMKKAKLGLIDDCDLDLDKMRSNLKTIKKFLTQHFLILSWKSSGWHWFEMEHPDLADEIRNSIIPLSPLREEDCKKLIERRISFLKGNGDLQPIPKKTIEEIAKQSFGIPGIALNLCYNGIRKAFEYDQDSVTVDIIREIVNKRGYIGVHEKFKRLDEISRHIIFLILTSGTRGIFVENIVNRMGIIGQDKVRDRSTIVYHLSKLQDDMKLIKSNRMGKYTYYIVQSQLAPLLELEVSRYRKDVYAQL